MTSNRITDAIATMEGALALLERRESLSAPDNKDDLNTREGFTESLEKLRDGQQRLLEERKLTIDKLRADLKEVSDRKEEQIQALTAELRGKSAGVSQERHEQTLAELSELRQKAAASVKELNSLIESFKHRENSDG